MIITDIIAESFLKYARLELRDLPARGVIAIAGANESGKSSIGEVICFGLFGRTFSLGQEDLQKVIRWGEPACSISLRFQTSDQVRYQLTRTLDRDGNHGVRLALAGGEEQALARGQAEVEEAIYDLLGYGYDEFIESYYLAQREIIAPQPHSQAVKSMAGLSTLEYVAYELDQEIEQEHEAITRLQSRIAEQDEALKELDLDPEALEELESRQQALQAGQEQLQATGQALESAFSGYREMLPKRFSARRARGRARLFRLICLVGVLLSGAAWGMLSRLPDHPYSTAIDAALSRYIPRWDVSQQLPWLLYAAGLFALLFLVLWIRVAGRTAKINRLGTEAETLATALESALQNSSNGVAEALAEGDAAVPEQDALPARVLAETISISELEPAVEQTVDAMRAQREELQQQGIRLGTALQKEQGRRLRGEQIESVRQELLQQRAGHDRRIELRQHALELLSGATRDLSQRFNRDLGESVSRTLPIFTNNSYQHLQIEDDLTVRVFSSQKRDFMDLEEISSGTQRQIMLALRLALAQALNQRTEGGRQFVFLDEPFAFFDQQRTRDTLRALPKLDDNISQIWIVAQDFPADEAFDLSIACERQRAELVV